jgi:hypothetical protein
MKASIFKHIYPRLLLTLTLVAFLGSCKNLDMKQVAQAIQDYQQPLDEATVVNGLKQALEVGTRNSVSETSKVGGFYNNPLIHIALPPELTKVSKTLRKFKLGSYVDNFERQMNRAAEVASVEAKDIFLESIMEMSLADGWSILRGSDDAATQYFRRTTESKLTTKFRPAITNSMKSVGFYNDYRALLKTYEKLPFTKKPDLNIENYILKQSLDGLFLLVAAEEKKIRTDPSARVTDLLKSVFTN